MSNDILPRIRIAAAVIMDGDGRTYLVRKRGTDAFMQAGGKYANDGETPLIALSRELREELGCSYIGEPVSLGRFEAPAANEPDRVVEADLFQVELAAAPMISAEIEEAVWVSPAEAASLKLAPLTRNYVMPFVESLP